MNRKNQRLLLVTAILVGAVAIAVLLKFGLRQEPPKRDIDDRALLVDVMTLESSSVQFTVQSQGTVLPRTQTVLSAEVSGAIIEISPKFIAGGVFQPGEVLMRIDPTDYSVSVKQAQYVIPMAISLSFGILFATAITLFLIPALYMLQLDMFARGRYLWDLLLGRPERAETSEAP